LCFCTYHILGKPNVTRTTTAAQIADLSDKVDNLTTMVERLSDFLGLDRTIPGNKDDRPHQKTYDDKYVQTEDESRPPSILPARSRPPSPLPVPIVTPALPSTPMPPPALLPFTMAETVPGVNIIEATPLNSQEAAMVVETQPTGTPPPSTENASFSPPSVTLPSLLPPAAVILESTDLQPPTTGTIENPVPASPQPSQPASSLVEPVTDSAPSGRSRTPRPVSADRLEVPNVSPPRTRSRTRSRSPTPLAGKRKADKDDSTKPNSKRRKM
jgi:hypothetical protein